MAGFTQEYFTPFLLLIGATVKDIGILNALPNFFASLIQLKSPDIVEKVRSRKKIIILFVFLQALMLLPMVGSTFISGIKPAFFIAIVILFTSCGAISTPAWGSVLSDFVPENKRGEYLGWRNKILGFIIVVSTFIAGFILHNMKRFNIFYGFAIIFGLSFIFRMISWGFLNKMDEPPSEYRKEYIFTIVDFLSRTRESNFAKFVLFVSMMSFSVNLAGPFFSVLMLRDLNFNYLIYTIVIISGTLMIYIMMGRWGKLADRIGNLRIIKFTSALVGIIPLLWIINRHPLFLVFAQIFSGFVWAGFNICASNFIFDAVTPPKRTRCIAYFNVLNGLAICAGALLGGFLAQKLPLLFGYKILSLFLLSSILRMLVCAFMPMKLKEVRPVEKVSNWDLFFNIIGMKPLLGIERKTIRY